MADGMTNRESAEEWQRFAKMDLDSAEFLAQMNPLPIEIICFHCQQSAEKSLKSILILNGIFPPKIHDLKELKELCTPYIVEAVIIDDACNHLNNYSVRTRYPKEIDISPDQLRKAIADSKVIWEYTNRFLSSCLNADKQTGVTVQPGAKAPGEHQN
ncbi:MAG: HEPN domain-containing protein [Spirochaetaceae bacterium]|jgi:HEPN domain-containing protein|nr:HEPN domain-containing protein [Spirochaetaceae bacterium]